MDISDFVDTNIQERALSTQDALRALRHATRVHRQGDRLKKPLVFKVELTPQSRGSGGLAISIVSDKHLENLFAEATAEYKRQNRCHFVDAEYSVSVVVTEDVEVPLPERFWEEFRDKFR